MMHVDGRDIYVDGDAITVRGGCELYITNSRIVASSTGVVVREGTVHIANSYVEGATASFDAANDCTSVPARVDVPGCLATQRVGPDRGPGRQPRIARALARHDAGT